MNVPFGHQIDKLTKNVFSKKRFAQDLSETRGSESIYHFAEASY